MGGVRQVWVGERGGELEFLDRGCTVPGLAAILRAQTLSAGHTEAVEGKHEELRALRALQEEEFRLHDYWMKAGLGQTVGFSTVRRRWAHLGVAGWKVGGYKSSSPHLSLGIH